MGFYDDQETAEQYVNMAEGYDGRELIEILRRELRSGAQVLELGMGPGVDLEILGRHFSVTGSDNSQYFLDRFRRSHPDADLLNLDAVRLDTNRTFDCIYSNKVLHHLDRHDLEQSLVRQRTILAAGGLVFHTFWHGEGVEEHSGLQFNYHSVDSIRTIFASRFETVAGTLYSEMEADDSLYVMARI